MHWEYRITKKRQSKAICRQRWINQWLNDGISVDADLKLRLTDSSGGSAAFPVGAFSAAAFLPPGNPGAARVVMNQVRVPMAKFAAAGVDVSNVAAISIDVAPNSDIQVSELAIVKAP